MRNGGMWLALGSGVLLWMAGCASTGTDPDEPRPRDGLTEYRQVALEARNAMHSALSSLATVCAQSNQCPPEVLSAFSAEMQRLQVDSFRLRARAQAMQARGDAYFEHWHEHLARVRDPALRVVVETRRPLFEESFRRVKRLSQEGREAFGPFASSLRNLRNSLEADPASLGAGPTQTWIAAATQNGERVDWCLGAIVGELDSMRALLRQAIEDAESRRIR